MAIDQADLDTIIQRARQQLEEGLFNAVFERLNEAAAATASRCEVCGLGCERERQTVRVRTTRCPLEVEIWRYRCRPCCTNRCPVREWLVSVHTVLVIGVRATRDSGRVREA